MRPAEQASITPTSSFNGTVAVSVKKITPISTYGLLLKDSTGAPSMQFSQALASNASMFVGGGAYNLTSGTAGMNTGFGGQGAGIGDFRLQQLGFRVSCVL